MATQRERIIEYLKRHPEGRDDDELSDRLEIRPRQTVNACCNRLATEGLISRRKEPARGLMQRRPKLINRWIGG